MNKKIFFLLIGWMLVASTAGLYAQTVFVDQDEDVVTVPVTVDTVEAQVSEPHQIQVLERTWGVDLEEYLRDKIIYLSSKPAGYVFKRDIQFVYKVKQIPCKSGRRIAYLSMTSNREFFLSLEDPTKIDVGFYSCYLDYGEETTATTNSRHHTDDPVYGIPTPTSNGKPRKLDIVDF